MPWGRPTAHHDHRRHPEPIAVGQQAEADRIEKAPGSRDDTTAAVERPIVETLTTATAALAERLASTGSQGPAPDRPRGTAP